MEPRRRPARTERFVSALREAGAVALLAGEEAHGEVPALAAAARTAASGTEEASGDARGGPGAAHVATVGDLTTLEALLAGVPDDVREVYRTTVLGPLLRGGRSSNALLLETLEVLLAHNCSWARTAETLHLHVNTVHYRVQRVETLTGRDLSRLDHRPDLRAALPCR
ncbi:helix-turn-helix domain-containing protein [Streptomyces sp. NPDC058718]|uniref:helix-turn-helix domain-containing protein n=1 Tax=Streptomyces sp. NPDC058718 TaxID=3346610 RepID=UPI00368DADB3